VKIVNLTRERELGSGVEVAETPAARRKGLLGKKALAPGEGLWIRPCASVHTFFMRFPIDLVYLDRQLRVKKVKTAVPAWRISACLWAYSVLELPAGTVQSTQTQPGDRLAFY